jgi:hypothetical protein
MEQRTPETISRSTATDELMHNPGIDRRRILKGETLDRIIS